MKKRILPLLLCIAVLLFSVPLVYVYTSHSAVYEEETESEEDEFAREQTGAWEAMQMEIEKTKDPKLGYVPKDRLLKAYTYTEQLRKKLAAMRAIPGINWQERGPNDVAGRTNAVLIDANDPTGNTIWAAGSTGGLWKTTNMKSDSTTWSSVNDFFQNLAIVTIAQDSVDPQVMYFGTGDINVRGLGMWKSTNGGTTWTQIDGTNKGGDFFDINRIIITPERTVLVATSTGLMRSTDQGVTWTKVTTGNTTEVIQAKDGSIYIGVTAKIRKSTDDGKTFSANLNTPTLGVPYLGNTPDERGSSNTVIAAAPSNPKVLYAMASNNKIVGGMARSDDGGITWTSLPIPKVVGGTKDFTRDQAWYDLEVAVDPENESHVWIGGIDLLRSRDKGLTWQGVSHWYGGFSLPYVHADQHFILFDKNDPKTAYFGCDGGVFTCTNTRADKPAFIEKNKDYNITYFYAVALHPTAGINYIMAGAQDNGTQVMTAAKIGGGKSVRGGDGMFCHIDQDNPNIHIAAYIFNDYSISTDGGKKFVKLDNDQDTGRFVNPTDWHNKSNRLYTATVAGKYRVYLNPVPNSPKKDVSFPTNITIGQVSAVTCSETVGDRVWFGMGNGTVVRVDSAAGNTPIFSRIRTGTGNGYISSIAVDPTNENHLLITSSSYGVTHVSETKNNGVTWTSTDGNLPDMPVRWAMFSPENTDHALIATELGVWSTDDLNGTATEWAPSNSGLANVRTDMLQYRTSDKLVAAATFGRGVFTTDFFGKPNTPPVVTLSATPTTATAPAEITLSATATDADGVVDKVEFYADATLLYTDTIAPYSFTWSDVSIGTYTLTAKATDNRKASTISETATVTIQTPTLNQLPIVSLSATPTVTTAPATVTLLAKASDPDGTIAKVDFYAGTTWLASDQTAPYSFSMTNAAAGKYTLTARATDNKGATTTSRTVSVVVSTPQSISGSACLAVNASGAFELAAHLRTHATGYTWRYTGSMQSLISTAETPYAVTLNTGEDFSSGQICVDVTYSEAPYVQSYCKTLSVCGGIASAIKPLDTNPDAVVVQANPFVNSFVFRLPNHAQLITAELFDLKGAKQDVQMITQSEEAYEMQTDKLASGVYYLKVHTATGMQIMKVIKQ